MRDSVPSASYSSVCNVLRLWSISLIPTYRVYRHYFYFKNPIRKKSYSFTTVFYSKSRYLDPLHFSVERKVQFEVDDSQRVDVDLLVILLARRLLWAHVEMGPNVPGVSNAVLCQGVQGCNTHAHTNIHTYIYIHTCIQKTKHIKNT